VKQQSQGVNIFSETTVKNSLLHLEEDIREKEKVQGIDLAQTTGWSQMAHGLISLSLRQATNISSYS